MLTLRGSLTPGARREYAEVLAGAGGSAAATQEDAWQRAMELLFERLAVRWVIAGRADRAPARAARAPARRLRRGARVGARGAARALRRALPRRRRRRSACAAARRAAPVADRGRSPAETNRAVAGLSTNSSTLAALAAHLEPAALLVDREHVPARSRRRSARRARARRHGAAVGMGRARTRC